MKVVMSSSVRGSIKNPTTTLYQAHCGVKNISQVSRQISRLQCSCFSTCYCCSPAKMVKSNSRLIKNVYPIEITRNQTKLENQSSLLMNSKRHFFFKPSHVLAIEEKSKNQAKEETEKVEEEEEEENVEDIPVLTPHQSLDNYKKNPSSLTKEQLEDIIQEEKKAAEERRAKFETKNLTPEEIKQIWHEKFMQHFGKDIEKLKKMDFMKTEDEKQLELNREIHEGRFGFVKGSVPGGCNILREDSLLERFYNFLSIEEVDESDIYLSTSEKNHGETGKAANPENFGYKVRVGKEGYLRSWKNSLVQFPNKTMAHAVVAEWELQQDYVRPQTTFLTELFCRVADVNVDSNAKEKIINTLHEFFEAEKLCHREGVEQNSWLEKAMQKRWDPIVNWFNKKLNTNLKVFHDECHENFEEVERGVVSDPTQYDARTAFQKLVLPQLEKDNYKLVALYSMTELARSIVLGYSLFEGGIDYNECAEAAELDTLEQIKHYGMIAGEHDILISELKTKLAACQFFNYLIDNRDKFP